jgi:hypothetical protein
MEILLKKLLVFTALAVWLMPLLIGEQSVFDGTWKIDRSNARSPKQPDVSLQGHATAWTYKVSRDEITMTNPAGASYTAKLNGTDAQVKNDQGITTVSVKKLGTSTLVETDKRGSKVIGVLVMTVAASGQTAKASYDDKLQKRTTDFDLVNQ